MEALEVIKGHWSSNTKTSNFFTNSYMIVGVCADTLSGEELGVEIIFIRQLSFHHGPQSQDHVYKIEFI